MSVRGPEGALRVDGALSPVRVQEGPAVAAHVEFGTVVDDPGRQVELARLREGNLGAGLIQEAPCGLLALQDQPQEKRCHLGENVRLRLAPFPLLMVDHADGDVPLDKADRQ